jgi:hypothetical protein
VGYLVADHLDERLELDHALLAGVVLGAARETEQRPNRDRTDAEELRRRQLGTLAASRELGCADQNLTTKLKTDVWLCR